MALASSLTGIGWFVQPLVEQAITFAINHWGGAGAGLRLPAALERLREAINNVRGLVPIAQKIRSENEGLLESVKDLKDAAYDAEDILSELDYYRLQKEVEGNYSFVSSTIKFTDDEDILNDLNNYRLQEEVEGNDNSNKSSLVSSIADGFARLLPSNEDSQASTSSPPPSVVDNKVTITDWIDEVVDRIDKIVERLDRIFDKVSTLLDLHKSEEGLHADSDVSPGHRVTTSFVSSKQIVFGREETKAQIIDLLLKEQPAAASDVSVLPIIGVGGIGKTTLARAVYNDMRVKEHFNWRLWLYVSANFDVPRLTKEMLLILFVQASNNITNLDQLQTLLMENLCSKKFLLVLDDVWNDTDSQKWDMLCGILECGKPGSRILLTTRLDTVVRMVGKTIDVLDCSIKLKGLPEDEYLSLFNKCAFGDEKPSDHSYLSEIVKQIARKLEGSPLAAKTVGSLLKENLDAEHWRSILSSDIWRLRQRPDDIMPVLKLSYQHLPVQLQQCFAYCCVFRKGESVYPEDLVRMWIAHGYINANTSGNKRTEDIGCEYYQILVARSFFEDGYSDNPNYHFFLVHDLFHDLAQSVSADECFIIDTNNQQVPRRVRHLSLSSHHVVLTLQKSYLRNLLTLIIYDGGEPLENYLLAELLSGLKSVRVLRIFWSDFQQLPHGMGQLIHLRYLQLFNPEDWRFNPEDWRLPVSLGRLYQLQYALNYIYPITLLPEIEKLTCLRNLDIFSVEGGRKIGDLKNLNQLGGSLVLRKLENVKTKEDALEAELSKKINIQKLNLSCNHSHTSSEMAEEVFEGLRPPDYIKELVIGGYGGVNTPTWMVNEIQCFSKLEHLDLFNCLKWKVLPPLGQLPFLRHLVIYEAKAVEVIGREFYGTGDSKGFPSLERLDFSNMSQLAVWSGIGEDPGFLFSRLRSLTLKQCPKLEQVPWIDLTSLTELHTIYMPLLVHPENPISLKELEICECESLPVLPTSLESLDIRHCPQVLTLFTTEQPPSSLESLSISACEELQSLPVLPTSLESLVIDNCPQLLTLFTTEQAKTMSKLRTLGISCLGLMSAELKSLPSLREARIVSCNRLSLPLLPATLEVLHLYELEWLTDLTMEQEEKLSDLTSLRELSIWNCPHLNSLPLLPASLKHLSIGQCPELNSLPLLPASLKELVISGCPELPRERYQEGGVEWNKVSHIPRITIRG